MSTVPTIANWTTINHPIYHKPYALVGTSASGTVLVVVPLFDLRDADLSGKVDLGEWFAAWIGGNQNRQAQEAAMLLSAAVEMADPDLYQLANRKLFAAGFSAGVQQFQKLYLKSYVSDAIGLALDQTSLSIISKYFIKIGFEAEFYRFLENARQAFGTKR